MADSFFNQTSHETSFNEDEEDTDYDALNGETFGEDVPTSDWEEVHEKLSSTLIGQRSFDDENNELSERVASFILDDEGEEKISSKPVVRNVAEPSTSGVNWWNGFHNKEMPSTMARWISDEPWEAPDLQFYNEPSTPGPSRQLPASVKILTVEEVEKKIIRGAGSNNRSNPTSPPTNMVYKEDNDLPVNMLRAQQNGQYPRNRQPHGRPVTGRLRYQPPDEAYHGMQRNMPQFSGMLPQPRYHDRLPQNRPRYPEIPPAHRGPGPSNHLGRHPHQPHMPRRPPSGHMFCCPMADPRFVQGHPMYGPRMPAPQDNRLYQAQPYGNQGRVFVVEPVDDYAGLMTTNEKNWLASIQTMQIYTNQPHQDDYYYQTYAQRQKGNSWKPTGYFNFRNREETTTRPIYTPHQFENSLGKLQVGSVMAPRLIIDSDVTENLDPNSKHIDKKWKQILLLIEEMYKYVLKMEPIGNFIPPAVSSQTATQDKILNTLLSEDKLVLVMSIKKGRRLVHRLLPYLECPNQLVHKLLMELELIMKKDSEQLLLSFLPNIRTYLSKVPLETLVEIAKKFPTSYLLSNQVTTSVMANMVERAEQVLPDCENDRVVEEWIATLARLAEACEHRVEGDRPVVGINPTALTSHLNLLTGCVQPEIITSLCNLLSNRHPGPVPAQAHSDL